MFTRNQYVKGQCSHDEYYSQFITQELVNFLPKVISLETLSASRDKEFMNDIPLSKWDSVAKSFLSVKSLANKFKAYGDTPSLGGMVCLAKVIAKQIRTRMDAPVKLNSKFSSVDVDHKLT